jgi:chromosome partitioning protein
MNSLMTCQSRTSLTSNQYQQIVLWIGANSGGVSKTTTAIHIGYEMARRGFNVALIDIDTNVSMNKFCGLPLQVPTEDTMARVFAPSFDGNYPLLTPTWGTPKGQLQVCLGGGTYMVEVSLQLSTRARREYCLADTLADRPLSHDLVIIDCPASLGTLSDVALAAATHILLPMDVTSKTLTGSDVLLNWIRQTIRALRLAPPPEILGVLPTLYNKNEWAQRELLSTLPAILEKQKIRCYPPVRYTPELKNASIEGVPLQIYRPKHAAVKEFFPVCDDLQAIIRGDKKIND